MDDGEFHVNPNQHSRRTMVDNGHKPLFTSKTILRSWKYSDFACTVYVVMPFIWDNCSWVGIFAWRCSREWNDCSMDGKTRQEFVQREISWSILWNSRHEW